MEGDVDQVNGFAKEKRRYNVLKLLEPQRTGCSWWCITCLSVTAMLIAISVSLLQKHGLSLCNEDLPIDFYSVVFDGGSTGSRMFVFHFKIKENENLGGPNVTLAGESFQSIEPGISYYAKNPTKATTGLGPMLLNAIDDVPKNMRPYTLLTAKATAGLRLLPRDKGDSIVKELRIFFRNSPFYLPDDQKIGIMDSDEEGLFGWIAVNFLLDVLWDDDLDNTASALDLGGGSLQTTFEFPPKADLDAVDLMEGFKLKLMQTEYLLCTHSFLGYGLRSARLAILQHDTHNVRSVKEETGPEPDYALYSPCHLYGSNFSWEHQSNEYIVKGTIYSLSTLQSCHERVSQFVMDKPMVASHFLWHRDMHLFSYFFDVAVWAAMIQPWDYHIMLTPQDYLEAAAFYCDSENANEKYPFLCMDLLYIYNILVNGLGIPADKQMNVERKIVGREVNWSLGAALAYLSEDFSYANLRVW